MERGIRIEDEVAPGDEEIKELVILSCFFFLRASPFRVRRAGSVFSWGKKSSSFVCFSIEGASSEPAPVGEGDAEDVPEFADDEDEEEREEEHEEKVRAGVGFCFFLGVAFSFLLRGPW